MRHFFLKPLALFVTILSGFNHLFGQDGVLPAVQHNAPRFSENKGQWNNNVLFRMRFNEGSLFLEKDKLTFAFVDGKGWDEIYHSHHGTGSEATTLKGHAYHVHFDGCNPNAITSGTTPYAFHENYFIGNDQAKWASNVGVFEGARYENIYPGIDLQFEGKGGHLKYSYIVQPGSSPAQIRMRYEGVEQLKITEGKLHYKTSVNEIFEEQLYVYQDINGKRVEVPCSFKAEGNVVTFIFPESYDPNHILVIDPTLVFGTFTGSQADNFGYTATYDNAGNLYAGGIARGVGYPTTVGAFQLNYAGGLIVGNFDLGFDADMSITKFNSTGTALIYSTYLGGSVNDQPHSLIVNANDELMVYGRSNSPDYPTTAGAYDQTHNGNQDIVVTKFNPAGSALIGSTYIGGSNDDGANISPGPFVITSLKFNYADDARGEVIHDDAGNIYVASCTRSTDFPTTTGAIQQTLQGNQDGCILKFNSTLTALTWATLLGGNGDDAAYSLLTDATNNVYTCGGTSSTNFPTTAGSLIPTAPGGMADGFIAHLSANGNSIINATYIGTNAYDQTYFIEQDFDNDIYIIGQTGGSYPVSSSGVYIVPNSGQFLTSLTPNLSTVNFSTVFGKGDGDPDISLTAFLVDNCKNIYISGWGGDVNNNVGNTFGFQITSDAYQATTDGSDFYFLVLAKDAASLKYSTFFGGPLSTEHVDGGTSRFDKNGVIYQAVCAGCGGFDDFPSTPGAWSPNNQSQNPQRNCNEGLAKFEFQQIGVEVSVTASPTNGCVPLTVHFDGNAVNATTFHWDFGNGTTSSLERPSYTFSSTGTYTVTLIGIDSTSCENLVFADTSSINVIVRDDSISAQFTPQIIANCDSFIVQFNNSSINATSYSWNFGDGLLSNLVSPTHEYAVPGTYDVSLIVTNLASCNQRDTLVRTVALQPIIDAGITVPDSFGCRPFTVDFINSSLGGVIYDWDFGDGDSSTLSNPTHTYQDTGVFDIKLVIIDSASCNIIDSAFATVSVNDDRVTTGFALDTLLFDCDSLVVSLTNQSTNYTSLLWDFGDGSTSTLDNPTHVYTSTDSFLLSLITYNPSACNQTDTVSQWLALPPNVIADFSVPAGCAPLDGQFINESINATSYFWQFWNQTTSTAAEPSFTGLTAGTYSVTLTAYNPATCNDSSTITGSFSVSAGPSAFFTTDDIRYEIGEEIIFVYQGSASPAFFWDFDDGNTSEDSNPVHAYSDTGEYNPCLTVTDSLGCDSTYCKQLLIDFEARVDVPNAFSPNGDGQNEYLYVRGVGVSELEFKIYNRWGELVFETTDAGIVCNEKENCIAIKAWDGTYKGEKQEMDVYVYTLDVVFEDGQKTGIRKGNITLLR